MSNTHTAEPGMLAETQKRDTVDETKNSTCTSLNPWLHASRLPVGWRGEEAEDDVPSLHVDDAARGV